MTIEEELFRKTKIDLDKLVKYGFKKENSVYKYSKNIMDNTFRVDVEIDNNGLVKGKVYDLSFEDEYTNFRIENGTGSFVGQVKEEFINLLKNIRSRCFIRKSFIFEQSNRITKAINDKYGDEPDFEWEKFPGYATFRNKDSKKWYGIIMNIDKSKLDKNSTGEVEVINIKLEPNEIECLLKQDGFYPAYHMNKKNWITIILDNTISDENIISLIDKSYSYTITNKNNSKNEWIIPANPKYFDIEKVLKESNKIMWKQSTDVKVNDIVYIYVAEPYSSIMYKFRVTQVNIPYEYKDKNLKMNKVMNLDLLKRYKQGKLSFSKLKEYGINAVRGPRYMPVDLSKYIKEIEM